MSQINNLIKLFARFAGTQDYSTAFAELIDHMLIPLKIYENEEERCNAIIRFSEHSQLELLISLMEEIGALSEGFNDPLGSLYEQLISKGRMGQFFTPSPLSDMLAEMSIEEKAKAGKTVFDPACGSGRLLLSAAKINRHLKVFGAEIDHALCKVTVVNMLLNSMTGEVIHMDSLSNEFYTGYKFGTVVKDGFHLPYYYQFNQKEESLIWRHVEEKKLDNDIKEDIDDKV